MKTNNKCAAVRLEKSKLVAALAILAVAFVVIAAVPAVDATDESGVEGSESTQYSATYYTDSANGVDAVDKGTADAPFKTLFYALKKAGAQSDGQKVLINVLNDEECSAFTIGKESGANPTVTSGVQNVVINLNGHTLTLKDPAVGSTGYKTQAFRTNAGNTVELVNGTMKIQENKFLTVINSHGNLTLRDMVIDGKGMGAGNWGIENSASETVLGIFYADVHCDSDSTVSILGSTKLINTDYPKDYPVYGFVADEGTKTTVNLSDTGSIQGMAVIGSVNTFELTIENANIVGNGLDIYENTVTVGKNLNADVVFKSKADNTKLVINKDATFEGNVKFTETVGGVTVTSSADVKIKAADGGFTLKAGSIDFFGAVAETTGNTITIKSGEAKVTENYSIPDGMTLAVDSGATLKVNEGVKLTVEEGAKVSISGTVTGNVEVDANATVELQTGGDVSGMNKTGAGSIVDKTSESDMSEMKISGTSETFVGTEPTVFGAKQLITVDGSWTLINGTNIVIKGKLIVPEGATLTIEPGAKLTLDNGAIAQIDGKLVIQPADDGKTNAAEFNVESGTLELNGAADIKGKLTVEVASTITGKVTIGQDAAVVVTSDGILTIKDGAVFEVQKSAVLTINGNIKEGTIQNYGTVVFDAQTTNTGKATVKMLASGAVVDVKKFNVESNTADALTIDDSDLVLFNKKGTAATDGDQKVGTTTLISRDKIKTNEIALAINAGVKSNASFGSFTVVETLTVKSSTTASSYGYYDGKTYVNSMDVAGNLAVSASLKDDATSADKAEAAATVTVNSGEKVTVSGEITVGTKVTLSFATGVKVDVSGSIDSTAASTTETGVKATLTNNGEITVSGEGIIKSNAALSATKINAVQYKTGSTPEIYNYVTIDKAIATVSASGNTVKALDVYGKNTVKTTAELPADVTMTVNSGATVTIGAKAGDDVTLTIAKGAIVKNNGTITVNGVLYALNKSNVKGNAPISDVYSEEMKDGKSVRDGWAKWTNVVTALNESKSGETITISKTGEYVDIKGSIEIKSGVTLVVPAGKAPLKLADGVTLTISGTLTTAEDIYAATMFNVDAKNLVDDKSSAIVVKGVLNADKGTTYNVVRPADLAALSAGAPIAGAYYNTEDHTNVISTLEIALTAAKSDITVYGAVTVGDIAFTATDDISKITIENGLEKTISADETAGLKEIKVKIDTVLTASSVILGNAAQLEFAAPAAGTTKGIFNGTVTVGDASAEFVGASRYDAPGSDVAVVFANESEGKLVLAGKVAVSDKGDKLTIAKGTVYVNNLEVVSINGTTSKGAVSIVAGAILEPVKNTSGSNFDALTVEGVLSVPAGTGFTAVTLTVPGTVTVGPSTTSTTAGVLNVAKAMYLGMKESDLSTGAGATVSGTIGLGTATVYVADGTTLDEDAAASINAMAAKATFHVDGKVWFTAYANNETVTVKVAKAPVTNAEFAGWATKDGGDVKYGAPTTRPAYAGWNEIPVKGDYYAVINTVIYTVVVNADEGIADVYLNGQAMAYGSIKQGENYVYGYISTVAAGDYKVTYTLKNGWSGDAKLYSNGTALGNNTLSVSGEKGVFNYQLSGVEKSGYVDPTPAPSTDDKDDGLTVTDYLLIVLVVLIVILAVIVAMRLMRS